MKTLAILIPAWYNRTDAIKDMRQILQFCIISKKGIDFLRKICYNLNVITDNPRITFIALAINKLTKYNLLSCVVQNAIHQKT